MKIGRNIATHRPDVVDVSLDNHTFVIAHAVDLLRVEGEDEERCAVVLERRARELHLARPVQQRRVHGHAWAGVRGLGG